MPHLAAWAMGGVNPMETYAPQQTKCAKLVDEIPTVANSANNLPSGSVNNDNLPSGNTKRLPTGSATTTTTEPHLSTTGGVSAGFAPMIVKLARSVQRVQQRVQQVHSATGSNVCTVCGLGTTAAPEIEKCTVYLAGKERAADSATNVRVRAKIIPTTVESRAYSASLASLQLQAALSATTELRRRVRRRVPLRRDRFGEDVCDNINAKVGSLQSQIVTLKQIT